MLPKEMGHTLKISPLERKHNITSLYLPPFFLQKNEFNKPFYNLLFNVLDLRQFHSQYTLYHLTIFVKRHYK